MGGAKEEEEMSQKGHDKVPRGRLDYVRPSRPLYELVQR